jgi:hypothetical protein
MENNSNNTNLQDDVLHADHASRLSSDDIAKAVKRHNREHKGDSNKAVQQASAAAKKH